MTALARIIAGCYEEMILCYDVVAAADDEEEGNAAVESRAGGQIEEEQEEKRRKGDDATEAVTASSSSSKLRLKLSFTDHPHSGSVRCIAASKGGMVASGSNDETIHVYNANTGRDVGSLMSHGGSVTSLQFHGAKYLVSGSEDANAVIWRTKPRWDVLKTLRGHKGPIDSVAVHPSGKIALSTGKDRTLKTWNLIKGRSAYVTNIKQEGSLVRWSPSGKFYALVVGASGLRVYDVATAAVVLSLDHIRRINALRFMGSGGGGGGVDDLILFGGEGKEMNVVSVKEGKIVASFDVHETRLRDLVVVEKPEEFVSGEKWVATGSNDGTIKLWKLDATSSSISCELLCEVTAGVRITCLCSYTSRRKKTVGGKGKANGGDEEEEDEEEERESDLKGTTKAEKRQADDSKLDEKAAESSRTSGKKVKFS